MSRQSLRGWCLLLMLGIAPIRVAVGAAEADGAKVVRFYGYDDCIQLENATTRVTLCPAAGGRVLEYSVDGKPGIYLPAGEEGWVYEPGKPAGEMMAGRFDIGPEQTIPKHPQLWMGRWTGEVTGARSARLTSQPDEPTGVQLIRDFELDATSTRLSCRQTIKNVSQKTREYCHWSRTFALGGGICIIPLTEPSRFPHSYVMYERGSAINSHPHDPKIRFRDGFLEITGAPKFPKLGMDSYAGWLAYVAKNDLMFVKRFPTFPDRVYNEVAGLTISIWYPDGPMCELEPIGPRERLAPGEEASFTETWWLLRREYPRDGQQLPLREIADQVEREAR